MASRRDFLTTGAVAVAAAAAGCSGDDAPAPTGDAGDVPVDAASRDAGGGVDAGMRRDAGSPRDGGTVVGRDGSTTPDGGDADGGPVPDPDAGVEEDAGPGIEGPESIAESPNFPLGVASGDVTDTSAILWTRYTGSASLELVVYE